MGVALLFIDGVGLGEQDPTVNPLARRDYLLSRFEGEAEGALAGSGRFVAADACFGVPGRPQSATNQAAILTGQPVPALVGKHLLGFPSGDVLSILKRDSIVKSLSAWGKTSTFANSYPSGYLRALALPHRVSAAPEVEIPPRAARRIKPSATTVAMAAGEVPFRTLDDAREGRGLTNDVTGERARSRGFDVPLRTAEEAADIFWGLSASMDFALFEHYLADEAGHAQDWPAAERALDTFDAFARAVLFKRPHPFHVFICSDHGNVEDMSVRNHTRNKVPVLYFGPSPSICDGMQTVADVGKGILALSQQKAALS